MSQSRINRRNFLGKTAAGLMGTAFGFSSLQSSEKSVSFSTIGTFPDLQNKIIYRTLGRTELKLPVLSFGVMNSDSPDLIRKAIEMGITHLDTAYVYLRGNSELSIGRTLEEINKRDQVYIGTKVYFNRDNDNGVFLTEDGRAPGATQEKFDEQLSTCLERLRTDYVDILYNHSIYTPEMVNYEPMMKALEKAKKEGKVRFIGISTHRNEPECIRAAVDAGIYDVILTSYGMLWDRKEEIQKAIAYAAEKNIGIVAMKTHGGNRLNRDPDTVIDHEAAFKWVLSDENVCTTIPGMTTFDQLDLNFKVMNDMAVAASAADRRSLEKTAGPRKNDYCQSCRSCVDLCSKRVDIPKLMRAHMYAEKYGNLIHAEITASSLPPEQGLKACVDCSSCSAVCRKGLDISGRLNSLIRQGFARA